MSIYKYTATRKPLTPCGSVGTYHVKIIHIREDGTRCDGYNGPPFPQDVPVYDSILDAVHAARTAFLASL